MPTPGELVAKLSEVLHVGQNTMTVFNRVLADAEPPLLPKGARGVNAVHRTPLDAARLLIALLSTSSPMRAAEVVREFGALECHEPRIEHPGRLTLAALCGPEFHQPHTFENALAALIGSFGKKEVQNFLVENGWMVGNQEYLPFIGIKVRENKMDAEINIHGNSYIYIHHELMASNKIMRAHADAGNETALMKAVDAMKRYEDAAAKYGGIRTERTLMLNELMPIATFVCAPSNRTTPKKKQGG